MAFLIPIYLQYFLTSENDSSANYTRFSHWQKTGAYVSNSTI